MRARSVATATRNLRSSPAWEAIADPLYMRESPFVTGRLDSSYAVTGRVLRSHGDKNTAKSICRDYVSHKGCHALGEGRPGIWEGQHGLG